MDARLGVLPEKAVEGRRRGAGQPRPGSPVQLCSDAALIESRQRRGQQDDAGQQLTPGPPQPPPHLADGNAMGGQLPTGHHTTLLASERCEGHRKFHHCSVDVDGQPRHGDLSHCGWSVVVNAAWG
jgi:hypothetical protein